MMISLALAGYSYKSNDLTYFNKKIESSIYLYPILGNTNSDVSGFRLVLII